MARKVNESNTETQSVKVIALRNFTHGKEKFYLFKRYEIAEKVAQQLAKDGLVKIAK